MNTNIVKQVNQTKQNPNKGFKVVAVFDFSKRDQVSVNTEKASFKKAEPFQ